LKQLDNFKLKQRFIYASIIALLVITSLLIFAYFQKQKRDLSTKEKQLTNNLLSKRNQLLADVSHELGTPLTVLKLQVESLKDDLEDDVHATYDDLDNKLTDIEKLITDIHQIAQSDIGALQLDFQEFNISDSFSHWQIELGVGVSNKKLSFIITKNLPEQLLVKYDRDKIKQVLTNLIANSVKYTDKPGEISLHAEIRKKSLKLVIEDSAPGVPEEDLTHIFERLYRVESSRS